MYATCTRDGDDNVAHFKTYTLFVCGKVFVLCSQRTHSIIWLGYSRNAQAHQMTLHNFSAVLCDYRFFFSFIICIVSFFFVVVGIISMHYIGLKHKNETCVKTKSSTRNFFCSKCQIIHRNECGKKPCWQKT